MKTSFFLLSSPNFGRKIGQNLIEDLFFCSSPNFGRQIGLNLSRTISVSDLCSSQIFYPPLFKILRTLLITHIRQKCEILTIDQLLFKEIAFMFKQSKNKNSSVFIKIFVTKHSQYNTRNDSKIIPKFYSMCQQSISHRGPSLWSKVPTSFKSQDLTIASFNLKMRKILSEDLTQV